MPWEIVVLFVGLVVLYFWLSPDPFASAVRAKVPFLQKRAAKAIDSVDTRVEAAKAAQAGTVRKGRLSLYSIQQSLAELDVELSRANDEIENDKAAMALAHKQGDRETFDTLVEELNRDVALQNSLVETRSQIVEQLESLEVTVDEQRAKERLIESQGRVMVVKARVNDVMTEINEARANLTDNGADAQMEAAQKILDATTARAKASETAAAGLTPDERSEKKAREYMEQARRGNAGVNADDMWKQLDTEASADSPGPDAQS